MFHKFFSKVRNIIRSSRNIPRLIIVYFFERYWNTDFPPYWGTEISRSTILVRFARNLV